jgi:ATP-dependent helicase/nuclease subunit A
MVDAATSNTLPALTGEQAGASHPRSSDIWLSASAGTGKTQVLAARVLRLLLNGARPESILCITFTKAGAAEMAERINTRLAHWVRARGTVLAKDLGNLGEDFGPDAQAHARTLFARVLDAPGGGLRIQTIHSFCQSLLGSFPAEAGLPSGFRPIEGREEALLAESTLADMVADAERGGEAGFIQRVQALSHRLGDQEARAYLRRCTGAREALAALGPPTGMLARVRRSLSNGIDDIEGAVRLACSDGAFDSSSLLLLRSMNAAWVTKTGTVTVAGQNAVSAIDGWLEGDEGQRYEGLETLRLAWRTKAGDPFTRTPDAPGYVSVCDALDEWLLRLIKLKRAALIAPHIANALTVGQRYANAYAEAKRRAGVVDFNDLIAHTVSLLSDPGVGAWIAYKLDQRTDHILVDEAQDTNAAQWTIVKAIADEFYAGAGAKGERVLRTLFTVGDYKQAIFGFQGTDPKQFQEAQTYFFDRARAAERDPHDLSLARSFRSSQPVLDLVNAVITTITPEAFGLDRAPPPHRSGTRGQAGAVTLWSPVRLDADAADDETDAEEEGWISDTDLVLARNIATEVRRWIDGGLTLHNHGRVARPGDVLILVRSRKDLARLIVSRLVQADVPVAGIDRLRLDAPIAVKDLMACVRFVLQPADDLNLAALLVSPLIGWSQDELYVRGKGRTKATLWQHLGDAKPEPLLDLLNRADLSTPHRFIEHILSGPLQGRRRLLARLGEEARDPIEELVNAALSFEREGLPSLQRFVEWFDGGENEIKRESGEAGDAVRVMTVHGAKGLQAPIVILADATADPEGRRARGLDWEIEPDLTVPVFRPRKDERVLSIQASADNAAAREGEEHWRLLYVALTRAEEYLFIGGALNRRQLKNGLGKATWYSRVEAAMRSMGAVEEGGALIFARGGGRPSAASPQGKAPSLAVRPDWMDRPAPEEARPPRPLAPSAIRPDDSVPDPPASPAMRDAAERGIRLHGLFERLPAIPAAQRVAAAERWLEHAAGVKDREARAELVQAALAVIEHPAFAELFSGDALAEAPLAGVVGDDVIAGTVDRLLIGDDRILVVDFKTGRRVPDSLEAIPPHHLAQMAAYAAVLEGIFPGRTIEAALLYSHGPVLHALPPEWLSRYDPRRSQ